MDTSLQAQMLTERCQMYLRHLRGVVYLLNYQSQAIRPGVLPPEWPGLMRQISHLAESTEREIRHFNHAMGGALPEASNDKPTAKTRAA